MNYVIQALNKATEWATGSQSVRHQIESGTKCSKTEFANADAVKIVHDLIEEFAYLAFANIVAELDIKRDAITAEQSGRILSHIKAQAHKEMYKKEGNYIQERARLLDPSQIQLVIQNVGLIVHDRDNKLTDARYYKLSELLMGLDDHNAMVKELLLKAWYKCPDFSDPDHRHLEEIKGRIGFYDKMDRQLDFNLRRALDDSKTLWNTFFPGMREAALGKSEEFIRVMEVRHFFGGPERFKCTLSGSLVKVECLVKGQFPKTISTLDKDAALADLLDANEAEALFEPRMLKNTVRCKTIEFPSLISDKEISIGQLMQQYFPDVLKGVR